MVILEILHFHEWIILELVIAIASWGYGRPWYENGRMLSNVIKILVKLSKPN